MQSEMPFDIDALLAEADWFRPLARSLAQQAGVDSDDLIQDTLETALRRPPSRADRLRPWLRRVMLNLGSMQLRSEKRRRAREERVVGLGADRVTEPDATTQPEILVERAEQRRFLAEAMVRINEPYRRTLLWHFFEGWSTAKIAQHEGVTASTVRGRIKRGLDSIRLDLAQQWGMDWQSKCLALASGRAGVTVAGKGLIFAAAGILAVAAISWTYFQPNEAEDKFSTLTALANPSETEPGIDSTPQLNLDANSSTDYVDQRIEVLPAFKQAPENEYETILIRAVDASTGAAMPNSTIRLMSKLESMRLDRVYKLPGRSSYFQHPFDRLQNVGETDTNGELLVKFSRDQDIVLVDAGQLRGWKRIFNINPPFTVERSEVSRLFEIPLWPILKVNAEIRTQDGLAAFGAPIALCIAPPSSQETKRPLKFHGQILCVAQADANGLAQLVIDEQELRKLRDEFAKSDFQLRFEVRLRHPGGLGNAFPVHVDSHQNVGTASMRLPRMGEIKLRVNDSKSGIMALLTEPNQNPKRRFPKYTGNAQRIEAIAVDQSNYHFPFIPLGHSFSLIVIQKNSANVGGSYLHQIHVPPLSQSNLVHRTEIDLNQKSWIRGQLAMPDQSAIQFRYMKIQFLDAQNFPFEATYIVRLEDDGSFAFDLQGINNALGRTVARTENSPMEETRFLYLSAEDHFHFGIPETGFHYPGGAVVRVPPNIEAIGADLGVILLGSAPIIAKGKVIDSNGNPCADCLVNLDREWLWSNAPAQKAQWDNNCQKTRTDDVGNFSFAAVPRDSATGNYRLRAFAPKHLHATAEIKMGDKDVVLQLPQTGQFHFSYRFPPSSFFIAARLIPVDWKGWEHDDPSANSPRPVPIGWLDWWQHEPNKLHHYHNDSVPIGDYFFKLRFESGFKTVQEVSLGQVQITPGQISQPLALQNLDVLSFLTGIRYELVDQIGAAIPVEDGKATLLAGAPKTTGLVRGGNEAALPRVDNYWLLSPQSANSIGLNESSEYAILAVEGYQPVKLRQPFLDQRIELKPEPTFTISVEQAPQYSDHRSWSLELIWLDNPPEVHQYSRRNLKWTNDQTKIQLPGYGRYRLHWYLQSADGKNMANHQEITRFPASGGQKEFTLVFPEKLLIPD